MSAPFLTPADYENVLSVIHKIAASESPEKLASMIVHEAGNLIPSHSCGWVEIHADTGFSHGCMNVPVDPSVVAREMAHVIYEHPVFQAFAQTRDGGARAISDCLNRRRFQSLDVYFNFLKKYRTEDQLIIAESYEHTRMLVLTLNRDTWGFNPREKAILNSLRVPLFQTHRRLRQLSELVLAREGLPLHQQVRPELVAALRKKGLCRREAEVAAIVAEGGSNGEIAAALGICEGTVRKHVNRLFLKLGVHNRSAATRAALALLRQ